MVRGKIPRQKAHGDALLSASKWPLFLGSREDCSRVRARTRQKALTTGSRAYADNQRLIHPLTPLHRVPSLLSYREKTSFLRFAMLVVRMTDRGLDEEKVKALAEEAAKVNTATKATVAFGGGKSRWKLIETAVKSNAETLKANGINTDEQKWFEIMKRVLRQKKEHVLMPTSTFRKSWDLSQAVILIYLAIMVPFRIGFNVSAYGPAFIFELLVEVRLGSPPPPV